MMALGPYIFTVPTFAVDQISRSISSRVSDVEVIGQRPRTHLLGPGPETISFSSKFYPNGLNQYGDALLSSLRQAVELQTPMVLVSLAGAVYGRWIILSVGGTEDMMSALGKGQIMGADIQLKRYVGRNSGVGGLF